MVVFYYTSVAYADCAIETINALKKHVELHVVIEVAPESKSGTIIEAQRLDFDHPLVDPAEVLSESGYQSLKPYFDGCASVKFVVHSYPKSFSIPSLKVARQLVKHIDRIRPGVIHFDTITHRSLGIVPYLYVKYFRKVVISIHDPVPHTAEFNWRIIINRRSYYSLAAAFCFYSDYSRQLFEKEYPRFSKNTLSLKMQPYTSYRNFARQAEKNGGYVLFFGRISQYKGVDDLVHAIPLVLQKFPKQKFIIAGSNFVGYQLDTSGLQNYSENVQFINRHIMVNELADLIEGCDFVVCPYKEATQSGVLMTAFSCDKPVVATAVGAFREYVVESRNGLLVEPGNPEKLSAAIIHCIENDFYLSMTEFLEAEQQKDHWNGNVDRLVATYRSLL
ncbi:glycosyltransferase family 4 protein [Flavihumibacter solisilvae]|uniref:Glycosyl transferase family 1 domain-containing protein n=1 Tax=Flavihumibacter solisilvae TaxID=1349421 RepID=A0A0C1L2U6_9BACT|nr:glycosyltransferase family 4 protein [Flavihumibacter solisilvae]KIC94312.1 hypothetical protein OI18_11795 [Flavihumibacter solisilvae]